MTVFREIDIERAPEDVWTTGTLTAGGQAITLTVPPGFSSWVIAISGGPWTGTIDFESSTTGVGTDWSPRIGGMDGVATNASSATANGTWRGNIAGFGWLRVHVQPGNWTSGTASILIRVSQAVGAVLINRPLPAGTNTIGNVGIIGTVPISISSPLSSGNLPVVVQNWQNPQPVSISGTLPVSISSPNPVPVSGTVGVSGTVPVSISTPTTFPVSGTVGISGTVPVSISSPTTFPVSGSVGISGTPSVSISSPTTFPVSGTVGISGTVPVSIAATINAAITNLPATQPVSGTVSISGTVPVSISGLVRMQSQAAYYASSTGGAVLFGASTNVLSIAIALTAVPVFAIMNPSASTKTIYIDRVTVAASGLLNNTNLAYVERRVGITGVTGGAAATPVNEGGGATASVATLLKYVGTPAIAPAGSPVTDHVTMLGALEQALYEEGALILPPGKGVVWVATLPLVSLVTVGLYINAKWWEGP